MKKVLFAIDNQRAERKLSDLIREGKDGEKYEVVGTPVSNESVMDFLTKKHADILVYMEGLVGKDDGFEFVLKLHRQYPNIRIVFIAGQREVGDKKLAMLVAFHIYDIVSGQKILMPDIANRIMNPASFEDVMRYLPEVGSDLFKDSDSETRVSKVYSSGPTDADRIAERVSTQRLLDESKARERSLTIKLESAEARALRLEEEKEEWDIALGKERLLMEKQFGADKKLLIDQLSTANELAEKALSEKEALEAKITSLSGKLETAEDNLRKEQLQSSQTIKALHSQNASLDADLKKAKDEASAYSQKYETLKRSIDEAKKKVIADAQTEADAIIQQANQQLKDAQKIAKEAEAQRALYTDITVEEYRSIENKKIEEAQIAAQKQIDEAIEKASAQCEKMIADAEAVVRQKEQETAEIDDRSKQEHDDAVKKMRDELDQLAESIKKKQRVSAALDQSIAQKQAEYDATKSVIDIKRQENETFLKDVEAVYAKKIEDAHNDGIAEAERVFNLAKNQHAENIKAIEEAFTIEKKRLSKEFEDYSAAIMEEKRKLEESMNRSYVYSPEEFSGGREVAKSRVALFYSPTAGSGNSSIALNVATCLAMMGHRTIYIELNHKNPTLKENLGIGMMRHSLDVAFRGVENRDYGMIDNQIITKQQILSLKTLAKEMQAKYPDMLSFLTYTQDDEVGNPPNADMIKALVSYLKLRKNYSHVILDIPSYISPQDVASVCSVCNRYIWTTVQDIPSLNMFTNRINQFKQQQCVGGVDSSIYVINKYINGSLLGVKKICSACGIDKATYISHDLDSMLIASYKSAPALLISKNQQFANAIKTIAEHIRK